MIRRINNLARLHNKMLARYGANDTLVRDIKAELDAATRAEEDARVGAAAAARHLPRTERWRAFASAFPSQLRM